MLCSEFLLRSLFTALVVLVGGCSLVVDFDRRLLVDAAVDGEIDAGSIAVVGTDRDASVDTSGDMAVDEN